MKKTGRLKEAEYELIQNAVTGDWGVMHWLGTTDEKEARKFFECLNSDSIDWFLFAVCTGLTLIGYLLGRWVYR